MCLCAFVKKISLCAYVLLSKNKLMCLCAFVKKISLCGICRGGRRSVGDVVGEEEFFQAEVFFAEGVDLLAEGVNAL